MPVNTTLVNFVYPFLDNLCELYFGKCAKLILSQDNHPLFYHLSKIFLCSQTLIEPPFAHYGELFGVWIGNMPSLGFVLHSHRNAFIGLELVLQSIISIVKVQNQGYSQIRITTRNYLCSLN